MARFDAYRGRGDGRGHRRGLDEADPPNMTHPEKGITALRFDDAYDLAYATSMDSIAAAKRNHLEELAGR